MTSMITFISNLPVFALLPLFVLSFVLASLGLLFFIHKQLAWLVFTDSVKYADIFSNCLTMIFGFMLAFITVAAWENHNDLGDTVSKETNTLQNMYRTLEGYPPEFQEEGKKKLKIYVSEVIEKEWPAMALDQYDVSAYQKLRGYHNHIIQFQPKNNGEIAAHQEELRLFSSYRELRRDRVEGTKPIIDKGMWSVLILSAVLFMLFLCLFKKSSLFVHALMIKFVATSLSLIYFLLVIYDHPFIGSSPLSPEPFQKLLDYYWLTPTQGI